MTKYFSHRIDSSVVKLSPGKREVVSLIPTLSTLFELIVYSQKFVRVIEIDFITLQKVLKRFCGNLNFQIDYLAKTAKTDKMSF